VRSEVAHSVALLRAAEQQLRLRNTDGAIDLLVKAEAHFSRAEESVSGVPDTQRFALQKRVTEAREEMEDFRVRLCEL
jgi:hypothetical protein